MPSALALNPPWQHGETSRRSFWLAQAIATDPPAIAALQGHHRADVCIVGGGFTGLWTALELVSRAPGTSVRLLEADVCGAGASGANAGYLMNLWPKLQALQKIAPSEEAAAIAAASAAAVDEVLAFARAHEVECRPGPWLWAATNAAQAGAWEETAAAIRAAGHEVLRPVSAAEIKATTGAEIEFGGVVDDGCAALQPAALCRALAAAAIAAGVEICEHSPVTRIEAGARTTVHAAGGSVAAENVVLAINAWAAQLPGLGRKMVMVASDTAVTEPIPETLAEMGWQGATTISDSRRRLNYFRTTADGRLLFGKGGVEVGYGARGADRLWAEAPDMAGIGRALKHSFPHLAAPPVAHSWRAPVEYSVSSLPFCAQVQDLPSTWFVTGYSGDGVGPSKLMARILAAHLLGEPDEFERSALTRVPEGALPPEPLRWLGSRLVLPALTAAERREDEGARAPWAMRRLADLDPTDFVG
ncbi:MAG: FAD-dependent oxidoreductase [Actinobacteria bacterium]|nr:FAD-dependent oxidoreductase [Actinomycetota bacterium]